MKKVLMLFLCIVLIFSLVSCYRSSKKIQEIDEMFKSFKQNNNYVLLTYYELVISGKHYELSSIKYNDRKLNIVFLEEEGFYSYTVDETGKSCEFLYTLYNNFETILLGYVELPSKVIDGNWKDSCFYLRIDDPIKDDFGQVYCCFNTINKEISYVDEVLENQNYSMDKNRSDRYTFSYKNYALFNQRFYVIDNQTGNKKRISKSILRKFDEGKRINKYISFTTFGVIQAYVIENDIYLLFSFGSDPLADNLYYYIVKWNFDTEECEFVTTIYFDYYQEYADDMIIINK